MLSRIAESMFWIGRYVERAEDTARILDVQTQLILEDATIVGNPGAPGFGDFERLNGGVLLNHANATLRDVVLEGEAHEGGLIVHQLAGAHTTLVRARISGVAPSTIGGAWAGALVYRRLGDRGFQQAVMALLLVSGLALIWTSW